MWPIMCQRKAPDTMLTWAHAFGNVNYLAVPSKRNCKIDTCTEPWDTVRQGSNFVILPSLHELISSAGSIACQSNKWCSPGCHLCYAVKHYCSIASIKSCLVIQHLKSVFIFHQHCVWDISLSMPWATCYCWGKQFLKIIASYFVCSP